MSLKRGWCPTLDRPMQSGDGLLVRVQPARATLSPGQAHALAEASARHGNGVMELTQRGNVQLRGLRADSIDPFAQAMHDAAIPGPGPLLVPPLLGADPGLDPRTEALVAALEHAFATDPRLATVPAKFAIAIDGGGLLGHRPIAADLVAHADGRLEPASHADAPVLAGPLHRNTVMAGLDPAIHAVSVPPAGPGPTSLIAGSSPAMTADGGAYALAPPFGQFTAAMLHDLADLAAQHGTTIRTTPWRALLLARTAGPVHASDAWITDPADPRLLVTTCVGAPGCLRGSTPTRHHAALLRPTARVHLSGCIKGCAHPGPAPLTFIARDGAYDLVRDGRTTDSPAATGLTVEQIIQDA